MPVASKSWRAQLQFCAMFVALLLTRADLGGLFQPSRSISISQHFPLSSRLRVHREIVLGIDFVSIFALVFDRSRGVFPKGETVHQSRNNVYQFENSLRRLFFGGWTRTAFPALQPRRRLSSKPTTKTRSEGGPPQPPDERRPIRHRLDPPAAGARRNSLQRGNVSCFVGDPTRTVPARRESLRALSL